MVKSQGAESAAAAFDLPRKPAQALSVKRAQVEFHRFAALGEPERAMAMYREENRLRAELLERHLAFCGPLTPFLEIGANVGHSSYLLANRFGADGFALDISADALRQGVLLQDAWGLSRDMIRVAGDAANLPFADGSLNFVFAFQTLSQFADLDCLFAEVTRVLAPGGVFFFAEEPLKRMLSLRLFRAPYYGAMKPWERKLWDWGLLGFLVKDVIGAQQEEGFGIRQNHGNALPDWDRLIRRHFASHEYEVTIPERGWLETAVRRLGRRWDRYQSDWVPARLLGGTLAAFCKKGGTPGPATAGASLITALRCPDCHGMLQGAVGTVLRCTGCGFEAAEEGRVYTLLPRADRAALYPEASGDKVDFADPRHEAALGEGWHELEGVQGNRYRWMTERATVRLTPRTSGRQRLRIRGFVHEDYLRLGERPKISVAVNGTRAGRWGIDRPGLTVLEAELPPADRYQVEIAASPPWRPGGEDRTITWNVSCVQLIADEPARFE